MGGVGAHTGVTVFVAPALGDPTGGRPVPLPLEQLRAGEHRVLVCLDPERAVTAYARVRTVLRSSRVPLYGTAGLAANQLWAPCAADAGLAPGAWRLPADCEDDAERAALPSRTPDAAPYPPGTVSELARLRRRRDARRRPAVLVLLCPSAAVRAAGGFAAMLALCPSRAKTELRWLLLPPVR